MFSPFLVLVVDEIGSLASYHPGDAKHSYTRSDRFRALSMTFKLKQPIGQAKIGFVRKGCFIFRTEKPELL